MSSTRVIHDDGRSFDLMPACAIVRFTAEEAAAFLREAIRREPELLADLRGVVRDDQHPLRNRVDVDDADRGPVRLVPRQVFLTLTEDEARALLLGCLGTPAQQDAVRETAQAYHCDPTESLEYLIEIFAYNIGRGKVVVMEIPAAHLDD